MDFREYVESNEEAWMWVYSVSDTTAVNMDHVVMISIKSDAEEVLVLATTITDEDIVLHSAPSGGAARDFIRSLLVAMNNRKVPTNYGNLE